MFNDNFVIYSQIYNIYIFDIFLKLNDYKIPFVELIFKWLGRNE